MNGQLEKKPSITALQYFTIAVGVPMPRTGYSAPDPAVIYILRLDLDLALDPDHFSSQSVSPFWLNPDLDLLKRFLKSSIPSIFLN